jgi:ankyrin repeat protein
MDAQTALSLGYDAFRDFCLQNRSVLSNTFGEEKQTILHLAASSLRPEYVSLLLSLGCDSNAPDTFEWTPLHCKKKRQEEKKKEKKGEGEAN